MRLWSDGSVFAPVRSGVPHLEAVERVKDTTRARFGLADGDTVLVTESAAELPGFPPRETKVVFWTGDGTRHHFRVFKPVEAVADDDVPPAWLRERLSRAEGEGCSCC